MDGQPAGMRNTIKGNYEAVAVSPGVTDIIYTRYRTGFLAMLSAGLALTAIIIGIPFGLPLMLIGGIGTLVFKGKGTLTVVAGQGIRFKDRWGTQQQVPFSEVSRVAWEKVHPQIGVYRVSLDTNGKSVIVATNLNEAVAQDLQKIILAG